MKNIQKIGWILLLVPVLMASCTNKTAQDLKTEIEKLKSQCPIDQGDGVSITDVNFFEKEKIVEYITAIEDLESIEPELVQQMKSSMITNLSQGLGAKERLSVTSFLKQGFVFRYIFTDTNDVELGRFLIADEDF